MKVTALKMTAEQVKADEGREYNPQVWEQNVDRMSKYSDVEFYKVSADENYSYNRYYVAYTLPEGLRLLNNFGYSSSITNGGFFGVHILEEMSYKVGENGQVERYEIAEGFAEIDTYYFKADDDNKATINNTPDGRKWMTERCKTGSVFTKTSVY